MRTIIIEDDNLISEIEKIIIGKNKYLNVVGCFNDSYEALEKIEELCPEVIFLDINMPKINGIEVARRINEINNNVQIIFVTAYEKYALQAFKVNAIDYIVKPITEEDINIAVRKILKYKNGISFLKKEEKRNKIFTLGKFEAYGNIENKLIKWPTAKVEELFAYFVTKRGKATDKWKLCELLWPTVEPAKALHNLHNSIYRLKQSLKANGIENIINYEKGYYSINISNMYCDLWECEDLMMLNLDLSDENKDKYEKIIKIYNGNLFQNQDYIWAIDLKEELDRFFLNIGKKLSMYYYNKGSYYKSEEILRRIIKENSLDEDLIDLAMKNEFQFKNKIGIINTFKTLKNSLRAELDVVPRSSTEKLYLELINSL